MVGLFATPRSIVGLAACLLTIVWSAAAPAQTINLSLNVYYSTPSNTASGGTWELVAKSSNSGLSGLSARIKNINSTVVNEAPRATYNGNPAGFSIFANSFYTVGLETGRNITIAQSPNTVGQPQGLFYGVGTLSNGSPGMLGPPVSPLTGAQDIPWAVVPVPPPANTLPNSNDWLTAARLASGTFPTGLTPSFFTGNEGNVFLSVGTSTTAGNISDPGVATVSVDVRTNFVQLLGDYNQNGKVDAADYVVWRKTLNQTGVPPGTGADGNNSGTIDAGDLAVWRANFGLPTTGSGSGTGAGLSGSAVPEPASIVYLFIGATLIGALRRKPPALSRVIATAQSSR